MFDCDCDTCEDKGCVDCTPASVPCDCGDIFHCFECGLRDSKAKQAFPDMFLDCIVNTR